MKAVTISQRVDVIKDYGEVRDALDEQWYALFQRMDAVVAPLPNNPESIPALLERIRPDAVVLSGGDNPVEYGGGAPQRDGTDRLLIRYAIRENVPLLGVCRGMQSIALYFGGTLKKVDGHIATSHMVAGEIGREVNSYHAYAVDRLGEGLEALAKTKQGDIEAIRHTAYPIYGMMWHPERVAGFDEADIVWIRSRLNLG